MPSKEDVVELSTMFKSIMRNANTEWNKRMQGNMSLSQFKLLYWLKQGGQQRVSDLAEKMCISAAAITGLADKLSAEGNIDRVRDEEDRRVVYIDITDKGKATLDQISDDQKETLSMMLDCLAPEDIAHLKRIFRKLNDHIHT
ncbi:DNA-binding transcriptional regulator, MarR family [Paenibacillus algorifonticola]|uniref:DNA-binding transcriptional regulator, MarR family n=1 Tax=Paenibacillus algorifonticola TaxID=684063 RepID=A0A1I2CFJ2_9BACL|nr:MarR family transcriptional regulator [Paenibacillus algorifonticola]SFE67127.1 DNA-binding transcriptional regulator, MarR family [Paenibacillus algorifonticola]